MCPRVAVATEGPASEAVTREVGVRAGWEVETRSTEGRDKLYREFPKLLASVRGRVDRYVVAPDLHPNENCATEAARWNQAIRVGFPNARLCLAVWETEAWLLADPAAIQTAMGFTVTVSHPDYIGGVKPSRLLDIAYRKRHGYRRGLGFDKKTDGAAIARVLDLGSARARSPSLDHFLRSV